MVILQFIAIIINVNSNHISLEKAILTYRLIPVLVLAVKRYDFAFRNSCSFGLGL